MLRYLVGAPLLQDVQLLYHDLEVQLRLLLTEADLETGVVSSNVDQL